MPQNQNPTTEAQTITDSLGRVLTIRELNPADMLDLIEASGSAASNPIWMNNIIAMASIAAIDGAPFPVPNTKAQIRNLAQRIGNDGMAALTAFHHVPRAAVDEVPKTGVADDGSDTSRPMES